MDKPIRLRSERSNVGFAIGYKNLMNHTIKIENDVPF